MRRGRRNRLREEQRREEKRREEKRREEKRREEKRREEMGINVTYNNYTQSEEDNSFEEELKAYKMELANSIREIDDALQGGDHIAPSYNEVEPTELPETEMEKFERERQQSAAQEALEQERIDKLRLEEQRIEQERLEQEKQHISKQQQQLPPHEQSTEQNNHVISSVLSPRAEFVADTDYASASPLAQSSTNHVKQLSHSNNESSGVMGNTTQSEEAEVTDEEDHDVTVKKALAVTEDIMDENNVPEILDSSHHQKRPIIKAAATNTPHTAIGITTKQPTSPPSFDETQDNPKQTEDPYPHMKVQRPVTDDDDFT